MRIVLCVFALPFCASLVVAPAGAQGLRGDVHVGLDSLHDDGDSNQGITYGLTFGYDLAAGRGLIGLQLDLDASDNKGCETDVVVAGDRACADARRDWAASLRAGVAAGGGALLYGTLGYANARFEARYRGAGVSASESEALDGVRLGAGIAADLTRRFYGKLEYRYTNYEQGVSRHQGLAGVGLRF